MSDRSNTRMYHVSERMLDTHSCCYLPGTEANRERKHELGDDYSGKHTGSGAYDSKHSGGVGSHVPGGYLGLAWPDLLFALACLGPYRLCLIAQAAFGWRALDK